MPDIDANVGLFTRQLAVRLRNVERSLCVEPEPGNFGALQYNVAQQGDRVRLWNLALSDHDGDTRRFRDAGNFGNYSLNEDAMRGRTYDVVPIHCAATDRWMREHLQLAADERLIWKSDTLGYDEFIISHTHRWRFGTASMWR